MISYAQNFEDVTLWRALHGVSPGRYVDVGAFHPEIDSVTKWFYDQGWSGINLEPVPEMFEILDAARPRDKNIRAAAGAQSGVAEMAVVPESMGLSSLAVPAVEASVATPYVLVQVEVRPLRDVLEPFSGYDIHFLKIDAEGTEHDVLFGMDFTRFRPWVVVVEATAPLSQTIRVGKWEDILVTANYRHAYFDGLNEFYVAAEKTELAKKLAVPPNVFDKFELAAMVRERQAREEIQGAYNEVSARSERLQSEISRRDGEITTVREELARTHSELAGTRVPLAASIAESTRLGQELAAAREELEKTNLLLAESQAALEAERGALSMVQHKLNLADQETSGLHEQLRGSEAAIAGLGDELSELAQALRKARETEGACQMQLHQVLNSRSFRWLAHARRMRALLLPHRQ